MRIQPARINGRLTAPASKSYAQRAVAAALLAPGRSHLAGISLCDDTEAAIAVARNLGADISLRERTLTIDGGFAPGEALLNCGEAGLCIRMFTPIAALSPVPLTLTGHGSLVTRPLDDLEAPLTQLGASFSSTGGCLPLTVQGPLKGGDAAIDGSLSSQFITGLLMACPLARHDTRLRVSNPKSLPYLDMTLEVLAAFGIEITHDNYQVFHIPGRQTFTPTDYAVEGDWSGAAFPLVAGAVAGRVQVDGLNPDSRQADRAILRALEACGAGLRITPDSVTVESAPLRAFAFDATHCPDLFPPLAALAAYCEGVTTLRGVERLKHKESDRGTAIQKEFSKMGVTIKLDGDTMVITGGKPAAATVDSHGDHRMAMAAAVTALAASGPVDIQNPACVAKSYPGFFDDLARLGGSIAERQHTPGSRVQR
ncbi:MAG: 3-phosphoshikimate 1-carboxyvinyltransferase [Lentisphaeria bacterium]|nr:3-phosphoshikimate 1-carboxyvinyltransferase [Lentisphaeria bacterium]